MSGDTDRPWERIADPRYFRSVIQNTRRLYGHLRQDALVRFSLSSDPSAPDYRIVRPDGFTLDYAGRNWIEPDLSQLSDEEFTVQQVRRMYKDAKLKLVNRGPGDAGTNIRMQQEGL